MTYLSSPTLKELKNGDRFIFRSSMGLAICSEFSMLPLDRSIPGLLRARPAAVPAWQSASAQGAGGHFPQTSPSNPWESHIRVGAFPPSCCLPSFWICSYETWSHVFTWVFELPPGALQKQGTFFFTYHQPIMNSFPKTNK